MHLVEPFSLHIPHGTCVNVHIEGALVVANCSSSCLKWTLPVLHFTIFSSSHTLFCPSGAFGTKPAKIFPTYFKFRAASLFDSLCCSSLYHNCICTAVILCKTAGLFAPCQFMACLHSRHVVIISAVQCFIWKVCPFWPWKPLECLILVCVNELFLLAAGEFQGYSSSAVCSGSIPKSIFMGKGVRFLTTDIGKISQAEMAWNIWSSL